MVDEGRPGGSKDDSLEVSSGDLLCRVPLGGSGT